MGNQLKEQGILFTTPKGDYDDSYCIEYARKRQGIIVSNDKYRDAVHKKWKCPECDELNPKMEKKCVKDGCNGKLVIEKEEWKRRRILLGWIRSHVITYMFVNDDFLPNPDFVVP